MKSEKGLWYLAVLLLTIALIVSFLFTPQVASKEIGTETSLETTTATESTSTPEKASKSPSVPAKATAEMPQVLLDISWCESRDDQNKVGYNYRYRTITLEDGSTTTEKYLWSRDIGRFQINDYYHAETAKSLGMDIYTEEGNALYALVLYNNNGTRDWNPSKPCWSDIEAWRAKEKSYY